MLIETISEKHACLLKPALQTMLTPLMWKRFYQKMRNGIAHFMIMHFAAEQKE